VTQPNAWLLVGRRVFDFFEALEVGIGEIVSTVSNLGQTARDCSGIQPGKRHSRIVAQLASREPQGPLAIVDAARRSSRQIDTSIEFWSGYL
jgi:hypothetical protein